MYSIKAKFDNLEGYDNVVVNLHRLDRDRIEINHKPDNKLALLALKEYFTKSEAEQVKNWIKGELDNCKSVTIEEVDLPIPENSAPRGYGGYSLNEGKINFYELDNYPLNYRIYGSYRLENEPEFIHLS